MAYQLWEWLEEGCCEPVLGVCPNVLEDALSDGGQIRRDKVCSVSGVTS